MIASFVFIYRVESFIEHQDACVVRHVHPDLPAFRRTCSPHIASSHSLSSETNFNTLPTNTIQQIQPQQHTQNNVELQLLPPSSSLFEQKKINNQTQLKLSIGNGISFHNNEEEKMKMAMAEMAFAQESREKAKRQIEMAELEFANAMRIRQQAQVELERAKLQQEQVTKKVNSAILEMTCHCCKQRFQTVSNKASTITADETSIGLSYMSSAVTEGEGD